jgi:hypothetical protein
LDSAGDPPQAALSSSRSSFRKPRARQSINALLRKANARQFVRLKKRRMSSRKLEYEKLTEEQKQSLLRVIWEQFQEEEVHRSKDAKPEKKRVN